MRPFKPEHYFEVSLERLSQAQGLYRRGDSFALAMYVAGVAVESLLRGFKGRRGLPFDEKHDLQKLFADSGLLSTEEEEFAPGLTRQDVERFRRELQAKVMDIHALWSNDYRYASEVRLRSHLKKFKDFRKGIRGDFLKAMALRLLDATTVFIDRGKQLWTHLKKN